MSVSITTEDVDAFHEQGYLVLEEVFDTKEVERMRGEADRILELVVNSSLANERQSGRLGFVEDDEGEQMVKKVQPINDLSLALSEASDDDRFLNPMREVMDDEPVLMEEKLNYKEPCLSGSRGSIPTVRRAGSRSTTTGRTTNSRATHSRSSPRRSVSTTAPPRTARSTSGQAATPNPTNTSRWRTVSKCRPTRSTTMAGWTCSHRPDRSSSSIRCSFTTRSRTSRANHAG
jgi:hypothetical protein